VHLTQGNPENIKLTTPADLKIAEVLINGIA
jgi:2-C-methyl-D-erythritol 4-phosphate cytidylyltransferase